MKNLETKKRRRFWQLLGITVLLLGLGAFVLKPAKSTYTVSPETTVAVGPLDADGYVDYVAALNERLRGEITPEHNASVLIWQALGPHPYGGNMPPEYFEWLGRPAPPDEGEYLIDWPKFLKTRRPKDHVAGPDAGKTDEDRLDRAKKWPWKTEDEPELAAWLQRNARPLDKFTEASKLTRYYNPLVPKHGPDGKGLLIGALLPNVQLHRTAALLFSCRAMLHLGAGRVDEAWTDLITCHRLGRLFQQAGMLIEQLVGIAVESIALQGEAVFLSHAKLTRQQVDACLTDLRALPAPAKSADKIDLAERFSMLNAIQSIARGVTDEMKKLFGQDGEDGDGALKLGMFSGTDWNVAMKTANAFFDRVVAAMRIEDLSTRLEKWADLEAEFELLKPDVKSHPRANDFLIPEKRGELYGNLILRLMLPAAGKMIAAEERLAQENEHLILAFALKARHLDTGAYPAKLEDLAPKYLAKIPTDRFAAGPLKYERRDNGYRFYSIGPNRIDDKGNGKEATPPGDDLTITMPAIGPLMPKDPLDP